MRTKNRKKNAGRTSKIILAVAVFNILWFTVAAIFLQFKTSVELSGTLITCWYGFWTAEIFALAGIKINKVKNDRKENFDESTD